MDIGALASGDCDDSTCSLHFQLSSSKKIIVKFFDVEFFTNHNKINKIKKRIAQTKHCDAITIGIFHFVALKRSVIGAKEQ